MWRQIGKSEATIEHKISVGKLVSSLLRDHLSRKQKDEAFQAILTWRYINERGEISCRRVPTHHYRLSVALQEEI